MDEERALIGSSGVKWNAPAHAIYKPAVSGEAFRSLWSLCMRLFLKIGSEVTSPWSYPQAVTLNAIRSEREHDLQLTVDRLQAGGMHALLENASRPGPYEGVPCQKSGRRCYESQPCDRK